MKKLLFVFLLVGLFTNVNAWEAYDFDVSHIRTINDGRCLILMKNLGAKQSDDANICDNPRYIIINDCTTESAKQMLSMAMTGLMGNKRMWHQAVEESVWGSSCAVSYYSLRLYPVAIGSDELIPVEDEPNLPPATN